jgi:GxxExxY protein
MKCWLRGGALDKTSPMPIACDIPIRPVRDASFAETDRLLMKCAYAAQNHFGRLCEERVYENDVAARLRAEGLNEVFAQVPLTVSLGTFRKIYRLDLVVNQSVFEFKVVDGFLPAHEAQVINYAALLGIDRIKLLNFGAPSVQGRLMGTPFARIDRREVSVDRSRWVAASGNCERLAAQAEACLREWGGFLEVGLYQEALIEFAGGESACLTRLPVTRDGLDLGHHRLPMHAEDCGFVVTALGPNHGAHERELRRLLASLPLRALQWVNIHHREMQLVTVTR